jgi:hypothetical protein
MCGAYCLSSEAVNLVDHGLLFVFLANKTAALVADVKAIKLLRNKEITKICRMDTSIGVERDRSKIKPLIKWPPQR